MKIAFFEYGSYEKEGLTHSLAPHALVFFNAPLADDAPLAARECDALSVFVKSRITEKTLAAFSRLKFIATRSTGFDHIDLPACKKRGIAVSSVPSYGENTVAEFAFALLLVLSRKIVAAANRVIDGSWSYDGLCGFDLNGKTMGVVGTGHIGRHIIRMATGFSMKVVAFDAFPNEKLALELGFLYEPLTAVLSQSDIVTLHIPYSTETHHLLNRECIFQMKKGALLINTSRGAIVETEALLEALRLGHLSGAGLDVLEGEDALKRADQDAELLSEEERRLLAINHALIKMENVVVTPHTAFYTREALERIWETTIENIRAFAEGRPVNLVQ